MSRARNVDLPNSAWAATAKMMNSAAIPPAVRAKNFLSRSSSIGTKCAKGDGVPKRHQGRMLAPLLSAFDAGHNRKSQLTRQRFAADRSG
jgi:hypothetical protein